MSDFRIRVIVDPSAARTGARQVERELTRINDSADRVRSTIARAFALIGIGKAIHEIIELADAYTQLQNRLKVVVDGTNQVEAVTQKLLAVANRSRSSFEATGELYSRVALATKDLGESQSTLLGVTETVNKAIILSGASAKEANNGLIQLSQGIASNRLGGDELRSVLEQLPVVADVIAKHLGKTRGELRAFGVQGGITGEVIINAFKGAREEIEGKFSKTVPTVGQGLQVLRNNLVALVGEFDKATGSSRTLSAGLVFLSSNLKTILQLLISTSAVFAAAKIAPYVQQVIAAAKAQLELSAALKAGTAVRINRGQAELQQAAFEQQGIAVKAAATQATVAGIKAQQASALVSYESTTAARTQAIAEFELTNALYAKAGALLRTASADQARLLASTESVDVLAAAQLQEGNLIALRAELAVASDAATAAAHRLTAANLAGNEARAVSIAQDTQLTALNATLTAETNALAAADIRLAEAKAAAASQATILGRSLGFIKTGITAVTAAIAANPIGAALVALTAILVPLFVFRNEIKLSGEGIATLGDLFAVTMDRIKALLAPIGQFFVDTFGGLVDIVKAVIEKIDFSFAGFLKFSAFIIDSSMGLWTGYYTALITLFQRLPAALGEIGTRAVNALIGLFEFGIDVVIASFGTLSGQIDTFIKGVVESFGHAGAAIKAAVEGNLQGAVDEAVKAQGALLSGTKDALFGSPEKFLNELSKATQNDIIPKLNNAFVGATGTLAEDVKSAFLAGFSDTTVQDFVKGLLDDAEKRAKDRAAAAAQEAVTPEGHPAAAKDPLGDVLGELRQQEQLLSLINVTNSEREVENDLIKIKNNLLKEGVTATPEQLDAIRVQLTVNQSLQAQIDLMNELRGPQEELQKRTDAANAAFARGAITGAEYARAMNLIKEASLSLADKAIRDLEKQTAILSITGKTNVARERSIELEKQVQELKSQGVDVTPGERSRLFELIARNQSLERQNQLIQEATPLVDVLRQKQDDANAAFARGALTADQYSLILRNITLDAAEASKTISGGLTRGFAHIQEDLSNMSNIAENTLVGAFQSAEDALVSFVKTGELNFVSLIDTIIEQLIRLAIQKALLSFLDFALPGLGTAAGAASSTPGTDVFGNIAGNAAGGDVTANVPSVVGEQGPEIFIPSTSGTIVPNDVSSAMANGGGETIVVPTPAPEVKVSVINVLDPNEIRSAMNSTEGEKIIMNVIRKNKSAIRKDI